ncbi:MAG TPA: complex I NDUFA9 subunit family protein [Phycisphaerae bacterium]|nr:complex I NDUFA9 subunit family protein [Phycisphaerae bacterium]
MSENVRTEFAAKNTKPILVTGAAGFVGRNIVSSLRQLGFKVRALVRQNTADLDSTVEQVVGNILDRATLAPAVEGSAAVIHLVGIIQPTRNAGFVQVHAQGTANVIAAAQAVGVKRFIQMSALGVRANARSIYHQTKWQAEQTVRESSMSWTIFRPSMIHGPGGEFSNMLRNWATGKAPPFLFMPYFGGGVLGQKPVSKIQPIYVGDVAEFFVHAIKNPHSMNKTYELGGPQSMTWPEFLHAAAQAIGGHTRFPGGIPIWLAKAMSRLALPGLPFTYDQVLMAQEDNTCDMTAALNDFPGLALHSFPETAREYYKTMQ